MTKAVDHLTNWIGDVCLATTLLTRMPIPHPAGATPSDLARAQRAFPLVGAMIGLIAGLVDRSLLAIGVPPLAAAALTLGAGAVLTGALHEDGLADVGDGFGGGRTRAAKLEIMRDSRIGTYGVVALLVGFSARLSALASLPVNFVVPSLVVAHTLGRAVIPVLAANMPFARDDGLGRSVGRLDVPNIIIVLVLAAMIALLCLPAKDAILAMIFTLIAASTMAMLAWRQIGGVTGDVFGATEQAVEAAVLITLAARLS
jgi:adenosylcobinamide-GDP ribazoletransferase